MPSATKNEIRPTEVIGAYSLAVLSGAMAAGLAGGSTIFSCRWTDTKTALLLNRLGIVARCTGTAFSAGQFLFDVITARTYSAVDSAQTALLPFSPTTSQKRRGTFGTTLLSDLRISSTGAITAGTRTLDASPFNLIRGMVPATAVNYPFVGAASNNIPGASTGAFSMDWQNLFQTDHDNKWPMTFVDSEGFVVRATVPATGTWEFGILMEWLEVNRSVGFN